MFNTVELAAYFISNDYKTNLSNGKSEDGKKFVESFSDLFKRVWSGKNTDLVPTDFKRWFEKDITFNKELYYYDSMTHLSSAVNY